MAHARSPLEMDPITTDRYATVGNPTLAVAEDEADLRKVLEG